MLFAAVDAFRTNYTKSWQKILEIKNSQAHLSALVPLPSDGCGANQPVVELVRWTVVSPTHQGSNPDARIISGFISEFPAMRFQWEEMFPSTTRHLR